MDVHEFRRRAAAIGRRLAPEGVDDDARGLMLAATSEFVHGRYERADIYLRDAEAIVGLAAEADR